MNNANNAGRTIPHEWHPRFLKNGETGCPLCGKPLKTVAKRHFIHVVDGGARLARVDVPEHEFDSMGWFEVGSSCARKLGPAWTKVLDQ